MADNTAALMALDAQSQGMLAPFSTAVDLAPLRGPMLSFLMRARQAMPWLPAGVEQTALRIMALNAFPRLRAFRPGEGARPAWLSNENNYQVWRQLIDGPYKDIDRAFLSQNAVAAAQATQAAEANTAFWNTIAKYSGADAVEGVWNDLWKAIEDFKGSRARAVKAVAETHALASANASFLSPALRSRVQELTNQISANDAKARAALAIIPGGQSGAGLGAVTAVAISLGASAIVATAATIWACVSSNNNTEIRARQLGTDILKEREKKLHEDLLAGRISQTQYDAGVREIDRRLVELSRPTGGILPVLGFVGSLAAIGIGGFFLLKHFKRNSTA